MQTQYLKEFQKKGYFTPWFEKEVNPSKPGVYLTAMGNTTRQVHEFWQFWDGMMWWIPEYHPENCQLPEKEVDYTILPNVWCGLTEEGYDYAKKLVLMED